MNRTFWVQPEESPAAYLSKQDFAALYRAGEFFQRFPLWGPGLNSLELSLGFK